MTINNHSPQHNYQSQQSSHCLLTRLADLAKQNNSQINNSPNKIKYKIINQKTQSIQSIHRQRKGKYLLLDQSCPLQVIKNHLNKSLEHKYQQSTQKIKRSAYQFFEQQKIKRLNIVKHSQYLLPKICIKSKRNYRSNNQLKSNLELNEYQKQMIKNEQIMRFKQQKQNKKQRRNKNHKRKKTSDIPQILNVQSNIDEQTRRYKQKCKNELKNISLKLPQNYTRQKCFFDLTKQQINELYSNAQDVNNSLLTYRDEQINNKMMEIQQNKKNKFKLISYQCEQQKLFENNQSVPLFLMQRLSLKQVFHKKRCSFLTQAPKIKIGQYKNKQLNQKVILFSSLNNLR